MTIGAEGVKVYNNLSHATIANTSLTASFQRSGFDVRGTLSYAVGRDADGDPLPLIAPLGYSVRLAYHFRRLGLRADLKGNARQGDYAPKYGETPAQAYAIVGLAADYQGTIRRCRYSIRGGVENLFDTNYSTYADWNKIPQKGRNVYLNLTFEL